MKKLFHKIICCAAAFAVGVTILSVPAQKAQAYPGSFIVDKIADEALDIVDGWVVDGLDYATDQTGLNVFSRIGDLISFDNNREVEKLCDEILGQLDSIEQKMDLLGADLDRRIAELEAYVQKYNWSENASKMAVYKTKYSSIYDSYQNYLSAAKDYANTPESNQTGRQVFLNEMDFFKNEFADAARAINFDDDIREMARLSCKYFPRYVRNKPDSPLSPTQATTTLDAANSMCDSTLAFEHQKYQMLRDQANDCMGTFELLMIVGSLWMDYNASLSPDGQAPSNIALQQQKTANEIMQAISDIATQGTNLTKGLMRPYDLETKAHLNYQKSSSHDYLLIGKYVGNKEYATMNRYATGAVGEYMPAYRVKPIGQNSSVLILQRNAANPVRHSTNVQFWSYHSGVYTLHTSSASQDYLNQMSTTDGYRMINGAGDLYKLLNRSSYPHSNYNIAAYLTKIGGLDAAKLPQNMTTAATSQWREAYSGPGVITVNYQYCHYWYVEGLNNFILDLSDKELGKKTPEVVVRDSGVGGVGSSEPLTMLTSTGTPAYTISTNNSAVVKVETDQGNIKRDGNIYAEGMQVYAGSPVKITLNYTDQNSKNSDVILADASGTALETLLIPAMRDFAQHNADGTITVTIPMPYQDCKILWTGHPAATPSASASVAAGSGSRRTYGNNAAEPVSTNIYNLDGLLKAAAAVRDNPEQYAGETFTLMNDIDAQGAKWSVPFGTEEHPFTGMFDGNGHTISGLIITGEAGGLFGQVGETGVVSDVQVYDTDVSAGKDYAGVIAAVNRGRLEYCRAGAGHLLTDTENVPGLDDMNVHVEAEGTAGGIVGKNEGELVNCSTTAEVKGETAGGLAGENTGIIHNSFGSAIAEIIGEEYSGGIAGVSSGTLKNVYFGGTTEGEKDGAIAGKHDGDAEACYYDQALDEPAGEGELAAQEVDTENMKRDTFAAKLNEKVSGEAYYWQRRDGANLGLPYLHEEPHYERTLTDEETGISLTGSIHAAARLSVVELAETESAYMDMAAENEGISGAYDIRLEAPEDPAFEGTLDIAFPGGNGDAETIGILHGKDGTYEICEAEKGGDGNYHVSVDSLSVFGLLQATPAADAADSVQPAGMTGTMDRLWSVLIGVSLAIAVGAVVCVFVIRARGKGHDDTSHEE